MPQCTKVTHFSPKLSLSTSPSSAFVPTCRFCCLLGCLSLCVPVRRSVETLFSNSHHSLYLARRRLTGAHTHTHTHTNTHKHVNQGTLLEKFSATSSHINLHRPIDTSRQYFVAYPLLLLPQNHLLHETINGI